MFAPSAVIAPPAPPALGDEEPVTVDATVVRVRTHGDGGWTILSVDRGGMPETWVGIMPELKEGMPVRATGAWEKHEKFGRQFKVQTIIVKMPDAADPGALAHFLAKLVPGIGIRTTTRLVETLGAETILALEGNDIPRLAAIKNMSEERAKHLCEEWQKHSVEGQLIVQLARYSIKGAVAKRVVKRYGGRALEVVQHHPFELAMEVEGIGFKTADLIAKAVGIPHDSVERCESGLLYAFEEKVSSRGHCYTFRENLFEAGAELLEVADGAMADGLTAATEHGRFVLEGDAHNPRIYLAGIYDAERMVAWRIKRLLLSPAILRKVEAMPMSDEPDVLDEVEPVEDGVVDAPPLAELVTHGHRAIAEFESGTGMVLAEEQRVAVETVMSAKVFVLTGGPGVGKTATTKAIIHALSTAGFEVACCAPTGRAAKRVTEATGRRASTIHRLLEFHPEHGFQRNASRPLQATAIVADEMSMTDVSLMANLLAAVDDGARLIIIGDVDQLPSVGPGAVLRDLIDSGVLPVVRLTRIFRQAAGSRIITNAHRVNRGQMPEKPQGESDFFWIERTDAEKAASTALQIVTQKLTGRGISARDCVVICPQRSGKAGVHALNAQLQAVLNPMGAAVTVGKAPKQTVFRVGDRVMQLKNDYERDVYNGDMGWVRAVDQGKTTMTVQVDRPDGLPQEVVYERKHFDNVTLAYACTGHKLQGGSAKAIIILMLREHYMLLSRQWLYTAISRGEKLVCLIADTKAVAIAVSETKREQRNTGLRERLQAALADVLLHAASILRPSPCGDEPAS